MKDLGVLLNELCPDGVPYKGIGSVIYRYSEKAKNSPEVTEVYSVSNTKGLIKAADYWEAQIHSEDTSNYNVVRSNMFAYRPAGIDVGTIGLMNEGEEGLVSPAYVVFGVKDSILPEFLMLNIRSTPVVFQINQLKEEGARVKFDFDRWDKIMIPVPPIQIQAKIIWMINSFEELLCELKAELVSRKKQYTFYQKKLMTFNETNTVKKLRDVVSVSMCKRIKKAQTAPTGDIPFYKNGTLGKEADSFISQELFEEYSHKYKFPNVGEVMLSTAGTVGRAIKYDGKPAYFQDSNVVWLKNDCSQVTNEYLYWFCMSMPWKLPSRGTIKHLHNDMILETEITIPSFEEQHRIVTILDSFYEFCISDSSGLIAEINARQKQYNFYRDKLLEIGRLS